ncbi:hypothetical protein ABMA32_07195 [Mesorhizobium sp. VNQ89]|uniref:hypothetical protein n=1 Tax=Mesorhizobium quangtriensis TaxID=3157709 RepID=UPI0032B7357A
MEPQISPSENDNDTVAFSPSEPDTAPATETAQVSDDHFDEVVQGALEAVSGELLFKASVIEAGEKVHVAAASVGLGDARQFLLLTLPDAGGQLKVEPAARSKNPLAGIAESYAGLMDVLQVAA